ncbi:MAG: NAD(P)-dependent oxidoreductase [Hyphomicrobiaceae bacterium]|nr:NAD(P)-dependent oxidoreductase [Hyphomicrobiaceae bacterium]
MGKAMARNIRRAGFPLAVHNRSRRAVEELVAEGASAGVSPEEVAARSEIVVLSLPDTPDVEQVLFAAHGVGVGARPGTIVIDTSTIAPAATKGFSERLLSRGVHLLDAPVSGGPKGAIDGTLSCMVGGSEAALDRAMPVFQAIGKTIRRVGESGAGQLCKACNQLAIVSSLMGVVEALVMAKRAGIDPYAVREALLGGSAKSFVLENHAKRFLDGTLEPGFRSTLMLKDMKLALDAARDLGVFAPATALGTELMTALCNTGYEGKDSAALGLLVEQLSGVTR